MAQNSSIEWTDHTFNPVRGCTKISPGCANCYAARDAKRFPRIRGIWGDSGTRIVAVPSAWNEPLKWERRARMDAYEMTKTGQVTNQDGSVIPWRRPRVFCASLADVFEDWKGHLHFPCDIAPGGQTIARWDGTQLVREFDRTADAIGLPPATMDHLRLELFDLIRRTPHLDWLLLTKRPGNWRKAVSTALDILEENPLAFTLETEANSLGWFLRDWLDGDPPANIWIGTTVEDQQRADDRIPRLLNIPAAVRFLSCEPLLGAVDLKLPARAFGFPSHIDRAGHAHGMPQGIHWVIAGGESGPGARPMHPEWARSLRDQCQSAGVAFFFKQWGEFTPFESSQFRCMDDPAKARTWLTMEVMASTDRKAVGTQSLYAFDAAGRACRMAKPGKAAAGRLLDGREWNELPTV